MMSHLVVSKLRRLDKASRGESLRGSSRADQRGSARISADQEPDTMSDLILMMSKVIETDLFASRHKQRAIFEVTF